MIKISPTSLKVFLSSFVICFLLFVASTFPVEAVGLQVTPSEIQIQSYSGQLGEKEIIVKNPSTDVGLFEIYLDDFESQILPEPSSFLLESGESRLVLVQSKFREAGIFKTNISVVVRPLSENSFNAAGGIKIPTTIEIQKSAEQGLGSIFSWFGQYEKELVGLLAFLFILYSIFLGFRRLLRKSKS